MKEKKMIIIAILLSIIIGELYSLNILLGGIDKTNLSTGNIIPFLASEKASFKLNKTSAKIRVGREVNLSTSDSNSKAISNVIWKSQNTNIAIVDNNGKVVGKKPGKTVITATANGKTAKCEITVIEDKTDYVDVAFLNIQNRKSMTSKTYGSNLAVALKTRDDKYVLIDTGNNNNRIATVIYNRFKKWQNKDNITIDYLILTHSHGDHSGNVLKILKNKKISVKNIIVKNESLASGIYNDIKNNLNGANLITTNDLEEGSNIIVGEFLKLSIYNTKDVYVGKNCFKTKDNYTIKYYAISSNATNFGTSKKPLYVYIDGNDFPNLKLKTSSSPKLKTSGSGLNKYFFATKIPNRETCSANANSLAILASVILPGSDKYMYFPGDIDNNGYDLGVTNGIYGIGTTIIYKDVKFDSSTKQFTGRISEIKVPAESNVAKLIADKLGDKINNIVFYQQSHHGFDNATDAVNKLKLNRKGVYAIATFANNPCKPQTNNFLVAKSCFYTLKNATILYTGGKDKSGVRCKIDYTGKAQCKNY